jgi:hypothetical protein
MERARRLRLGDTRRCWVCRKLLNVTGAAEPAVRPRSHVPRNSSQGVSLATRRSMSMSVMAMFHHLRRLLPFSRLLIHKRLNASLPEATKSCSLLGYEKL